MAVIQEYKCPRCGGHVEFDSTLQKMKCPYCESVYEISDFETPEAAQESQAGDGAGSQHAAQETSGWEESSDNCWTEDEMKGMAVYSCQSCGGQVIGDETMGSTRCPYCGNNIVVKEKFAGGLKPDYIIPFAKKQSDAMEGLRKHIQSYRFAPQSFYSRKNLQEIKGLYVPFWLFDSKADFNCMFEGKKFVRRWRQGDYDCTEYAYFSIEKSGKLNFSRIPADGSKKMDDHLMDALEPFDMSKMVPFKAPYLAGFLADCYDVSAEENRKRVNERVEKTVKDEVRKTISGYEVVTSRGEFINPHGGRVSYALLPVWVLTMKWEDKLYTYAVNGQTGKIVGEIPHDGSAFTRFLLKHCAVYSVIMTILTAIVTTFLL